MLIDSHFHLPHPKYSRPPTDILHDAKVQGVEKFISIGTGIKNNEDVIKLANEHEGVYCTIGIYPDENTDKPTKILKRQLQTQINLSQKVAGLGECGVDSFVTKRNIQQQTHLFEMQIELALENYLPIVVHNRNRNKEVLEILLNYGNTELKGVMHCFTSDWGYAEKILDLGFYISFTGIITYPSGTELLETVRKVPTDKYLIETDSPYLPPQGHRHEVNEPKYVRMVAEKVARVKGISFDEVSKQTTENTERLFKLT